MSSEPFSAPPPEISELVLLASLRLGNKEIGSQVFKFDNHDPDACIFNGQYNCHQGNGVLDMALLSPTTVKNEQEEGDMLATLHCFRFDLIRVRYCCMVYNHFHGYIEDWDRKNYNAYGEPFRYKRNVLNLFRIDFSIHANKDEDYEDYPLHLCNNLQAKPLVSREDDFDTVGEALCQLRDCYWLD
jgi:hypothetical protein